MSHEPVSQDAPEQLPLVLGHRVARGLEDFLVAPGNRNAVDWLDRWPEWPFTALAVVGPSGSGKTHLAELWRVRTGARSLDLRSLPIEEIVHAATLAGAVTIDNCDDIAGDDAAEETLLHLYNLLRAEKGHLLTTARKPPSQWGLRLPDLVSRMNSAMVATIDPPDDALLAALAVKLFSDRQLTVGEGVIALLLARGERSFAGMARTVAAVDHTALAAKRAVTVPLVRDVLQALDRAGETESFPNSGRPG
jgi:DnaA regulatory inactivator Hda